MVWGREIEAPGLAWDQASLPESRSSTEIQLSLDRPNFNKGELGRHIKLPLFVDIPQKDVLGPREYPRRALRTTKGLIAYLQHTGLD